MVSEISNKVKVISKEGNCNPTLMDGEGSVKTATNIDFSTIFEDTYLLITPSSKNACKKDGGKMLTMSSEDFLNAFQWLLAVPETAREEKAEAPTKVAQSKGVNTDIIGITGLPQYSSIGEKQYFEKTDGYLNGSDSVFDTQSKSDCQNVSKNTGKRDYYQIDSRDYKERKKIENTFDEKWKGIHWKRNTKVGSKQMKEVAVQTYIEDYSSEPNLCRRCNVTTQSTPTTSGKFNSWKDNFTNHISSPKRDANLKEILERVSSKVRNIYVKDYVPTWGETTRITSMKYIYAYLSLLQEFNESSVGSHSAKTELIKRYIWHMKKVVHSFSRNRERPEDTIDADAKILCDTRKAGKWSFAAAWKIAAERNLQPPFRYMEKLNSSGNKGVSTKKRRSPLLSSKLDRICPLTGDRASIYKSSRIERKDEELENSNKVNLQSGLSRTTINERRRGIKRENLALKHLHFDKLKRRRSENEMPRCADPRLRRLDEGRATESQLFASSCEKRKTYRLFNKGSCFKSGGCDFKHVCDVCLSPSHGQSKCHHVKNNSALKFHDELVGIKVQTNPALSNFKQIIAI